MEADQLPSWHSTPAKRSITAFVRAVTDRDSPDFVPPADRVAVFDNDGTLWTELPVYAQLAFAIDRAAELGHPASLEQLQAGGMAALVELVALTHTGITTDEFDALCRRWLASARHPRFGSVGETAFRVGDGGPELVKGTAIQVINDGSQKPSSIHRHVGQRPIVAAGNTDGDLAMLQWTEASPCRTLQLVVHHTDAEREYAYDRDPILGSGTAQILGAAADREWTVIDMAADWATVHAGS